MIPYDFQDLERLRLFVQAQFGAEAKIHEETRYTEVFRTFVLRFSIRGLTFRIKSDRGIYEIDVSKAEGGGTVIWLCRALPGLDLPETINDIEEVERELSLVLGSHDHFASLRSAFDSGEPPQSAGDPSFKYLIGCVVQAGNGQTKLLHTRYEWKFFGNFLITFMAGDVFYRICRDRGEYSLEFSPHETISPCLEIFWALPGKWPSGGVVRSPAELARLITQLLTSPEDLATVSKFSARYKGARGG